MTETPARVAIVTGAARGIGAATALRLAGDGEPVGRQPQRGGRADPAGGAGDDGDPRRHGATRSKTAATRSAEHRPVRPCRTVHP